MADTKGADMYDLNKVASVAAALESDERVCAVTVALKISDDSCKMDAYEKSVFMMLYDALPQKRTDFFDEDVVAVIETARTTPSAQIFAEIKRRREAAMEFIGRPAMKAFKAEIRRRISV